MTPEKERLSLNTPHDFERFFGVRYLSQLEFGSEKIAQKIQKRTQKALVKEWITSQQKWLGAYYSRGIRGQVLIDLTIRWIDEEIGYGVWTNRPIAARAFIGEYTGMLRKRRLWKRWENLYCFDYTIGPRRSTSFVIDSRDAGNYTRFINHSFHPNLDLVSVYCDGLIHVILYAKEPIPADTQLCYDYGEEYWTKRKAPRCLK